MNPKGGAYIDPKGQNLNRLGRGLSTRQYTSHQIYKQTFGLFVFWKQISYITSPRRRAKNVKTVIKTIYTNEYGPTNELKIANIIIMMIINITHNDWI